MTNLSQRAAVPGVVLGCLLLTGCSARSAASGSDASREDPALVARHGGAAPQEVAVDQAMLASLEVDVIRAVERPRTLTVAGKVQFDEDRVGRVLAPVAGQVVELRVKVGDSVTKGQPLCVIKSREVAAALGEHLESHKDLELAEKTAAMTQDLVEHEAASKIALQQAQNDLAKARARVERTEEALRVLGLRPDEQPSARLDGRVPIVSPLTGSVIDRRVTEGQFVQADSMPLISVGDLSTVWVLGDIVERDLRLVSVGDRASMTTTAYPGEEFQGRVNYISDVIDPATRTAKVRVAVPNRHNRLKPEMFASIVLGIGRAERVLTLPARALFTENGQTWVYVATAPRRFVRRAVELTDDEGDDRRVLNGLRDGERIVVSGALLLRREEEKRAE
jgi:cobalt-zinc-cadmium efflux system membrane fusion protein